MIYYINCKKGQVSSHGRMKILLRVIKLLKTQKNLEYTLLSSATANKLAQIAQKNVCLATRLCSFRLKFEHDILQVKCRQMNNISKCVLLGKDKDDYF